MLRQYGYRPPLVHYVGKAATFLLLIALPMLLLAKVSPGTAAGLSRGARGPWPPTRFY